MPGGGEIIVILILVLLLFGPDKLPDLARQLGRGVRELNRVKSNLTDQFNLMGDDETSPRSRNGFDAHSNAFSSDSRREEDETLDWDPNAANGNAKANGSRHSSSRDEDDLAEDQADWRSCEEEPQLQEPHAHAPQMETLSEPTPLNRLGDGDRPAPPGAVARSSSLPRTRNDDESAPE